MSRMLSFALVVACCVLMAACGGSMKSSPAGNGVPVSLSIRDTPPNGVGVLFFEASITGVSLQPTDSKKPAVSLMKAPVEVEFGHLQTDTAFLSLGNATPDTYQNATLTFGDAVLTIVNHSGMSISGCSVNSVCELKPSFNPTTATVTGTPFPITISQNSVVGIELDFDVAASVQNDLSINPTVTVKNLIQREDSDETQEMEKVDEIDGKVTTLGANQFTLTNERSGQSFNVTVDGNTMYEDFDRSACTASPADFTCVQAGQILDVKLSENGMGSMLAKRVEFEEDANHQVLKGTITSVDSPTQFHMVVFNEEPAISGIDEGSPVTVTIAASAMFEVGREEMGEDGGFDMSPFSFASGADLLVGQDVQIQPGTVSSSGGQTTVTTDLVRLWPSQITGQVSNLDQSSGNFSLTPTSPLFTGAMPPINSINVVTLSNMNEEDFSGFSSLTTSSAVSVKGLLFNTSPAPTLVTRTMREEQGD
jgi:hypothetical protein